MSHKANEVWIEAALENFDEAFQDRNLQMMKDIISDMRDAGFKNTAYECEQRARAKFSNDFADKDDQ